MIAAATKQIKDTINQFLADVGIWGAASINPKINDPIPLANDIVITPYSRMVRHTALSSHLWERLRCFLRPVKLVGFFSRTLQNRPNSIVVGSMIFSHDYLTNPVNLRTIEAERRPLCRARI